MTTCLVKASVCNKHFLTTRALDECSLGLSVCESKGEKESSKFSVPSNASECDCRQIEIERCVIIFGTFIAQN
jgi:hypothetical protein